MNIEKILRSGESQTVEFKESFDRESLETVVAFVNTRGGYQCNMSPRLQ